MTNYNFSSLADKWWDPNGAMKALHDINPIRAGFIEDQAPYPQQNTLIDIGCGAGILCETMAKSGYQVTGVDISKELIKTAISHAKIDNLTIDYLHMDLNQLSTKKQQFDIITCLELIEHIDNPNQLIQTCAQLCKPNGKVFISTLNKTAKAWLLAIVAAEYIFDFIPKGTHSYEKFITPASINNIAKKNNLKLIHTNGINYNPFTRQASLSSNMDINYILCFQKIA